MEIRLRVEAWEQTPEIGAKELARRLDSHFQSAVIDPEQGEAYVQAGLDRLIGLGAPDVILESHRTYFGNVIFAHLSEPHWSGAIATSYLHRMWPPLGDIVCFNVEGATEDVLASISHELEAALGMVLCLEAGTED